MNPALIITIIEAATKFIPWAIADIQALFAKGNPTAEDWDRLRAKVSGKSYEDYIEEARAQVAGQLPPVPK